MAEHEISDERFAILEQTYPQIANEKVKTTVEAKIQQESLMDVAELMWWHKIQHQSIDPGYFFLTTSEAEKIRKEQGAQQAAADSSSLPPTKKRKVNA